MWSFLITIILLLIFSFVWYIGNKYDNDAFVFSGIFGTLIPGVILVVMLISLATLQSDFDVTKEKYYNLKNQIEYVKKDDIVTAENLRNQVLEMNNKISSHKIYSDNWFIGIWYSKEIGNLPKLKWNN